MRRRDVPGLAAAALLLLLLAGCATTTANVDAAGSNHGAGATASLGTGVKF